MINPKFSTRQKVKRATRCLWSSNLFHSFSDFNMTRIQQKLKLEVNKHFIKVMFRKASFKIIINWNWTRDNVSGRWLNGNVFTKLCIMCSFVYFWTVYNQVYLSRRVYVGVDACNVEISGLGGRGRVWFSLSW